MQRQENVGNQIGKLRRDGIFNSTRAGESSQSTSMTLGMNCLLLIIHTLPTPKLLPSQSTNGQGATHTPYLSAVLVSHMGSLKRSKTPAGSSAPPCDPILEAHKCHLVLDDNRMYVCLGSFLPSFLISSSLKICFRGTAQAGAAGEGESQTNSMPSMEPERRAWSHDLRPQPVPKPRVTQPTEPGRCPSKKF